jgi:hypothetical protein
MKYEFLHQLDLKTIFNQGGYYMIKIGVVMVVQNDSETIVRSIQSFYSKVEVIFVSTDLKRGWSGVNVIPDSTLTLIRNIDVDSKIYILEGNFCVYEDPMRNETSQRQFTLDLLCARYKNLDWVIQVDADEEFLDFNILLQTLEKLPRRTKYVRWRWVQLFNQLNDGRFLVIVANDRQAKLEDFVIAHRPNVQLALARIPFLFSRRINKLLELKPVKILLFSHKITALHKLIKKIESRYIYDPGKSFDVKGVVLHYSYAKSDKRIREKLKTWGHSKEIDIDSFYNLWKESRNNWEEIHDFHPLLPPAWPSLYPIEIVSLKKQLTSGQLSVS